jgi:hypothetical protein
MGLDFYLFADLQREVLWIGKSYWLIQFTRCTITRDAMDAALELNPDSR